MSDAVFPTLKGVAWDWTKKPEFTTLKHTSALGIEKSLSLRPYPRWTFGLSYNFLIDQNKPTDDIQQIVGFYLNRYGSHDDFLYLDPTDCIVSKQIFGSGDGSTTSFQLCRTYGKFVEPVIGLVNKPKIYVGETAETAVEVTDFQWTTKGAIEIEAPASNKNLYWSGDFYYRCKFTEDESEYTAIATGFWTADSIEFKSVLI